MAYLGSAVSQYKLNENAANNSIVDSVSAINGNLNVNTSARTATGKINEAIDFTNSGDYIGFGAQHNNFFDGGGSVSCWFYMDSYGHEATYARIFDKYNWWLQVRGDTNKYIEFTTRFSGDNGTWHTPIESIATGGWHHVMVYYDSSSPLIDPVIYIDNVLQTITETSTPTGTRSSDSGAGLYIGNYNGKARTFDGKIDDVRFYDEHFDPALVTRLYNSGSGTEDGLSAYLDKIIISPCTNLTNWDDVGSTLSVDSSDPQVGEVNLKIVGTAADAWARLLTGGLDLSSSNYLSFWAKTDEASPHTGYIYLSNTAFSAFSYWSFTWPTSWTLIELDLSAPNEDIGGGVNFSDVEVFRVDLDVNGGTGYFDYVYSSITNGVQVIGPLPAFLPGT